MIFDEENFPSLPPTWARITVDDSCENLSISTKIPTKEYLTQGSLPVIDQGEPLIGGYTDDNSLAVTKNLPVVVFGDHTRALKFVDFHFAAGADGIKVLRPRGIFEPVAFFRLLQGIRLPNKGYARHYQHLRSSFLPVPPLAEQKRIADKLDSTLARVEACRDRLDRLPALLKRFRQSILAAATSGRLTEDWRPPRSLDEAQRNPGTAAPDSGADAPVSGLLGWHITSLGKVATDFSYGSAAKSSKAGRVPVLRMGNIQDGDLDWDDLVFTSDQHEIDKYRLAHGDVLFNRTNSPELVGKTAVFKGAREAIYAGYLIRVRCSHQLLPDYLNYCLGSPAGRDYCWQVKSDGVSQSNINAKKLAAFEFMLPPLAEQQEIVRRVEILFAFADRLEARLTTARKQAEQLTPALLAKAFRGELVPQDPNDEPASELLKRLATTRSEAPKAKRGRKASA